MKFFYDHFKESDIAGMYTPAHFFTIVLFVLTMGLALYFSRKMTGRQLRKMHWIVAISVTVMEIIKIALRVIKKSGAGSWMPLYYCSLFIYASWLALCKNKTLSRMGYAYICMGGVLASLFFTFYPSTSLAILPLWHPGVWHSFLYHGIMFYTGVVFLWKGVYVPKKLDALYYFIFIVAACIPSYFCNEALGTNCMFLHDAFKLPLLGDLLAKSEWAYRILVVFAQAVLLFWGAFGLDALCRRSLKEESTPEVAQEDLWEEEEEVAASES